MQLALPQWATQGEQGVIRTSNAANARTATELLRSERMVASSVSSLVR
jgi:hypothetical protein